MLLMQLVHCEESKGSDVLSRIAGPSSYVAKNVLLLSNCRLKGQTQAMAGTQLLGTITSSQASFDNASHYTTFRHHMTDSRWHVCQSIVKL